MFLDKTATEQNTTFGSQTSQNCRSPEYHFSRKPSQLSNGPSYGSKQLAIYELRLLERNRFAESGILDILPFGLSQDFGKIKP
jgi:hypothetical protein